MFFPRLGGCKQKVCSVFGRWLVCGYPLFFPALGLSVCGFGQVRGFPFRSTFLALSDYSRGRVMMLMDAVHDWRVFIMVGWGGQEWDGQMDGWVG